MIQKKIPKNWLIFLVGILFVMSLIPGEGKKALSQEAIIATDWECNTALDCPICVGGFGNVTGIPESDLSFFEELAYAKCDNNGKCRLSEYCLIWDCPENTFRVNETGGRVECSSVQRTLLDNTLVKFNENPKLIFGVILLIIVYFML